MEEHRKEQKYKEEEHQHKEACSHKEEECQHKEACSHTNIEEVLESHTKPVTSTLFFNGWVHGGTEWRRSRCLDCGKSLAVTYYRDVQVNCRTGEWRRVATTRGVVSPPGAETTSGGRV